MRPRTLYAKSGNVSIAYQVMGEGPIDLVFAAGWVTHLEYAWESPDYARFIRRLSNFSRLIRFDRRGMGLSDRDVSPSTLEERIDDIRAVLDAAGQGGPRYSEFLKVVTCQCCLRQHIPSAQPH